MSQRLDASRYAGTTHAGKTGIERSYEDILHGEPGYELVEVNADRRPLRVLERVAPTPGQNLYLTIDSRIQEAGEEAFADRAGASVAIDPRNGEVLAMISVPSFDPNLFVNGISQTDYEALLERPDKPLLNRALRGSYVPGSTIKPFLAAAGLELGLRRPSDTILSTGEFSFPGQKRGYRDVRAGGHGRVDLVQSLAQSVNTYYYSLALDMGIDQLTESMAKFGFGQPTGIDLVGESAGVLPSREWKRGRFNEGLVSRRNGDRRDRPGLLGRDAAATRAWRGDAGRRWRFAPAASAHGDPEGHRRCAGARQPQPPQARHSSQDPANWDAVREGMIAVVNGPTGTARTMGNGFPYVIAGKSGTAERYSRTNEVWQSISQVAIERHQVLFEAFTPAQDPRIAAIVALEAGRGGGHDAAPVVRKMLDAWLARRARCAASRRRCDRAGAMMDSLLAQLRYRAGALIRRPRIRSAAGGRTAAARRDRPGHPVQRQRPRSRPGHCPGHPPAARWRADGADLARPAGEPAQLDAVVLSRPASSCWFSLPCSAKGGARTAGWIFALSASSPRNCSS